MSASQLQKNRRVALWLFGVCALIFIMVSVGGITRLTRSGLSIVEWRPITGVLPPLSEQAWHAEFEKYKQFPEYQKINRGMSLEDFKFIFFWEFMHRLLGRVIGLAFLLPFLYFFFRGYLRRKDSLHFLNMFILGGLQGFIGWYMVKSGLVHDPHVSHYRLATHLLAAFGLFAYILAYALGLWSRQQTDVQRDCNASNRNALRYIYMALTVLSVVLLFQILYGAFVAGLKAGYHFNTFPLMNGKWIPDGLVDAGTIWHNLVERPLTVQFIHRILAWTLVALALGYFLSLPVFVRNQALALRLAAMRGAQLILAGILVQFLIGISTLLLHVPL
ncbi:MAG: COX15/CtaA family protein, partial [Leptospiraceae bacterium]|nr:COX15/CtaA family protein [Leptospiraceae bacterium]